MTEDTRGYINGDMVPFGSDSHGHVANAVGKSLNNLHSLISDLSKFDYNILFIGERGTGKEMCADFYIDTSRRNKNFEKINCAGFDDQLLRSELFGHEKGSFTDATSDKEGLFTKINNGGGIFLDELGDASEKFHASLLRILQTGDYLPLGANEAKKISNVSIIAATSKLNTIREDLRDRFKMVYIPPLARRIDDIPHLIKRHYNDIKKQHDKQLPQYISQNALDTLKLYRWPGNVRELNNALDIAILLSCRENSDTIGTDSLPNISNSQNLKSPDTSQKVKIKYLPNNSKPIPLKDFLLPPLDIELIEPEQTKKKSQTDLLEKIFHSISPGQYKNKFWKYYARKKIHPPLLAQQFKGEFAESTARDNLRKARERIEKTDID